MTSRVARVFLVGLVSLLVPSMLLAQRDDRKAVAASSLYIISAKAGAVNHVSGQVNLVQSSRKKASLQKGDNIEIGDKVTTGTDGKAEVLLNPGSYVRLAENSEFEFVTTSLDDLELNINQGSAIFEVIADKEFRVTVNTPDSRFYLIQSGIYRIDVLENGIGKISVWKGKAQVGNTLATEVKGGRTAVYARAQVNVEKFDKKKTETSFDTWSKTRAKEISQINARLMQREMNRSLINSFSGNSWNMSSGYGVWVQDPWNRSFCFLPFGYGWSSPYGFGLNRSIWNYSLPPQITYQIYRNPIINNPVNNNPINNPVNNPNAGVPTRPNSPSVNPGMGIPNGGGGVSPAPVRESPISRGADGPARVESRQPILQ